MAIKLGTAILQLTTNSAKYDAGIKKASKSAWRFKKEQESVLDSLRKQWAGYGKAAMAGATAMAAAGAYTIKTQLGMMDTAGKTANKLGMSTKALTGLRHAAEMAGVSSSKLDMSMQRMTRRIAEAAQGTGEAKNALAELGLDAAKLAAAGPEQALNAIADAMAKVPNQADKVRLSFKFFDSEGVDLVNMLEDGSTGLEKMKAEAAALGITISDHMAKQAAEAGDALARVWTIARGASIALADALAPAIIHAAESLNRFAMESQGMEKVKAFFQDMVQWSIEAAGSVARGAVAIIGAGQAVGYGLASAILTGLDQGGKLVLTAFVKLGGLMRQQWIAFTGGIQIAWEYMWGSINKAAHTSMQSLLNLISSAISSIADATSRIDAEAGATLKLTAAGYAKAAGDMGRTAKGAFDGYKKALNDTLTAMTGNAEATDDLAKRVVELFDTLGLQATADSFLAKMQDSALSAQQKVDLLKDKIIELQGVAAGGISLDFQGPPAPGSDGGAGGGSDGGAGGGSGAGAGKGKGGCPKEKKIPSFFKDPLGNLEGRWEEFMKAPLKNIRSAMDSMLSGISSMLGALASIPSMILSGLSSLPSMLMSGLSALLDFPERLSNSMKSTESLLDNFDAKMDNLLEGMPKLLDKLFEKMPDILNRMTEALPGLFQTIAQKAPELITQMAAHIPAMVNSFIDSTISALPQIIPALVDAAKQFTEAIISRADDIVKAFASSLDTLVSAFAEIAPKLFATIGAKLPEMIKAIIPHIPVIVKSFISAIVEALPDIIPAIVEAAKQFILAIVDNFAEILTALIDAAATFVIEIVKAVPDIIMALVREVPEIIAALVKAVPDFIAAILDNLPEIAKAFIEMGPALMLKIGEMMPSMVTGFAESLWNSISQLPGKFWEAFKSVFDLCSLLPGWVKRIFGCGGGGGGSGNAPKHNEEEKKPGKPWLSGDEEKAGKPWLADENTRGRMPGGGVRINAEGAAQILLSSAQAAGDILAGKIDEAAGALIAAAEAAATKLTEAAASLTEAAQSLMESMTEGLGGFMESFKTSMEPLMIDLGRIFGRVLGDEIKKFLDMLGDVAYSMGQLSNPSYVFAPMAQGGAFGPSGRVRYLAAGGIVNGPTPFLDAQRRPHVMGEAGPEAVMPLTRGPGGRLGVEAHGGQGKTINNLITINVSGSVTSEQDLIYSIKRALARDSRRDNG